MSKVVVFMNLTLDGVMQAPARPDEDRRGDFEHGGWATPYAVRARVSSGWCSRMRRTWAATAGWWIAMALSSAATNARWSSLLLAGFLYSPDEEYP